MMVAGVSHYTVWGVWALLFGSRWLRRDPCPEKSARKMSMPGQRRVIYGISYVDMCTYIYIYMYVYIYIYIYMYIHICLPLSLYIHIYI